MTAAADAVIKRLDTLVAARTTFDNHWRQCFDMTIPMRGSGFALSAGSHGVGTGITHESYARQKQAELLDSVGADAVRILAAALKEGAMSPNGRWFSLSIQSADDEEKRWLDAAADILFENIHASNFDAVAYDCMLDIAVAGWFALFIDEGKDGGLHFTQWSGSEVYCEETVPAAGIDTLYRVFTLTAEQAFEEYGDRLSEKSKMHAKQNPSTPIEFVHAIFPRAGKPGSFALNMPIASFHVERDGKHEVRESGFQEMPVITPRWMQIPKSCYAIGPVSDALPNLKTLNEIHRFGLQAADVAIAGMWIAEDDSVLNPRTVKIGPRKIVVANSVNSMKALQTGAQFQVQQWYVEDLRAEIRRTLMADQLSPQQGPQMTATEVHVRVELIRQLLGPSYGRMQAEFLSRMIARSFGLAWRAGVFAPPPQSLADKFFSVKYQSPLARAQKLGDVSAMDRYETALMSEMQVVDDIGDHYDWDKAVRHRSELLGVPKSVMRSEADVLRLRSERDAAQAQEARQADVAEAAAAGDDGAPLSGIAGLQRAAQR